MVHFIRIDFKNSKLLISTIIRLNSMNFEIFYPDEIYSDLSKWIKSALKIIENDINIDYEL